MVKLAKTSYYTTKKTVENKKKKWKKMAFLWSSEPKIGPPKSPNIKFELEYTQEVDRSGKPSQYISYMC